MNDDVSLSVRETVIEVEYPLVDAQLKELDEELEKAINQLNWTSEGEAIIIACVPKMCIFILMYCTMSSHSY